MKNSVKFILPVLFIMGFFNLSVAQQADSIQAQPPVGDEVISLGEQEIKITIEKPQVTIISDRIKPEFDDVHLDKSFSRELTGEGEKFVFEFEDKFDAKQRIDVDKLLKKVR
jgi:hypothetical protein